MKSFSGEEENATSFINEISTQVSIRTARVRRK